MKKTPKGEPGLGVVPSKDLRPNGREPLTERGPLCYVDHTNQVHNMGVRDARKAPASASFVQSIPSGAPAETKNYREITIQPGYGEQSTTHSRPRVADNGRVSRTNRPTRDSE